MRVAPALDPGTLRRRSQTWSSPVIPRHSQSHRCPISFWLVPLHNKAKEKKSSCEALEKADRSCEACCLGPLATRVPRPSTCPCILESANQKVHLSLGHRKCIECIGRPAAKRQQSTRQQRCRQGCRCLEAVSNCRRPLNPIEGFKEPCGSRAEDAGRALFTLPGFQVSPGPVRITPPRPSQTVTSRERKESGFLKL